MSSDERSFLLRVCEQFGLGKDIALMPTTDADDVAAELARLPEATRSETFDLLIQAAAADGRIVPAEREFLDVVASQLGLDEAEIEERLASALEGS